MLLVDAAGLEHGVSLESGGLEVSEALMDEVAAGDFGE